MLEPIQGEGGIQESSSEFLQACRQLADQHQAALIFDEIQCGLGRTGQLFAFQHFHLNPDIVTIGKMLQICATLFTDALRPAPGIISQTFTASTSAIFLRGSPPGKNRT